MYSVGDAYFPCVISQCELESNKQNAARQSALVQSLRDRIQEAEDEAVEKENFANRSDVTISSLRKEFQTQQDRLQQVESSLKHHISAEEEAASRAAKWESKVCDSTCTMPNPFKVILRAKYSTY